MGRLSTMEMVDFAGKTDEVLRWHLTGNHYPPLPPCVFGLAKKAIKKANDGKWDALISLKGTEISWRGKKSVPVSACIESWHLEEFLDENHVYTEELNENNED